MAMYYRSSSEIQADNTIQTLYLMNPNYLGYSDTQTQSNMLFSNSAGHALYPALVPHAPPQQFAQQQDISAAARHHYSMLAGGGNNQQTPRGLSLSLSAAVHHQEAGFDKLPVSGDCDFPAGPSNGGVNTMRSPMIMGSKYLKAAQELLDEVVNLGNHYTDKARPIKDPTTAANKEAPSANKGAASTFAALDLTTAQRQEIQLKKAKLNSMLGEVEQRCRQYHHQMQVIVAAFEQAAGPGSARSYTQLALKTILKQFRCLKSTISSQIKGLNKSLGDDEGSEVWRLRIVGRQQVGMAQNNAWRPQRGLPERAVSVLRAWLFQHFLHPYPKDLDKQMLAKETGLTRSQVSNWFINARVRLWKPMVEEMYLQETNNQPSNNIAAAAIKPQPTPEISPSTSSPPGAAPTNFIASLNMENNLVEKNPKKPRNSSINLSAAADQLLISTDNCLSMAAAANIKRYGIGELDQQLAAGFGQGNGFSLSLALPPTETFLSHRGVVEGGRINEGNYEIMGFHKFPAQLLPDYVA